MPSNNYFNLNYMLNLYFFFFLNINFKNFYRHNKKIEASKMFYINLFFFFIKSKLNYNNDCKVSYKIKKKFSRNFVILKAAFKHKIPKHILKKNQTKLIIKISYDNVRYNLDSISNSDLNKLFLFKNKIITIKNYSFFLPGHLYRVKCQLPILYNFNNFNNF